MNRLLFFKYMFFVGAIWNLVMAGPLFIKSFLNVSQFSGAGLLYYQGFLCAVLLFGAGYFLVGMNVHKNHGIVWLGAIGKILVFIFFLVYCINGHIPFYMVMVGIGDLIFAILFFIFLLQYKSITEKP